MEEQNEDEGGADSIWSEVSPVTLIVAIVTIAAVVGYGLLLIVEMFL